MNPEEATEEIFNPWEIDILAMLDLSSLIVEDKEVASSSSDKLLLPRNNNTSREDSSLLAELRNIISPSHPKKNDKQGTYSQQRDA